MKYLVQVIVEPEDGMPWTGDDLLKLVQDSLDDWAASTPTGARCKAISVRSAQEEEQ